jgi:hypothetical protein
VSKKTAIAYPDVGQLQRNQTYEISYRCTTPGPGVEQGTVIGQWNGDIDTWGKFTIIPLDGSTPLYLFAKEFTGLEPLDDAQ